jgi:pimeloyl-ACP methyl ester carboxylesterase
MTSRHVVLVHGAWHGAWCWAALQAELDRRGVASLAVDLPGHGASTEPFTDLHGDAMAVVGVLRRLAERGIHDPVLVGHSYGGAVITEAATRHGEVDHLVYIAAFALDKGESVISALGSFDRVANALEPAVRQHEDGTSTIDPVGARAAFYGSCDDAVVATAVARLCPQPAATVIQPTTGDPRRSIASTYVICERDQAVPVEHQRIMAARCASSISLDTDHSPFASMVAETADIIERIARSSK